MKAISLHQPWATLIALTEKRIETRGWFTNHRGPIAIHAAKTLQGIRSLPGDCEGNKEEGWHYGYIGDNGDDWLYQAVCRRSEAWLVPLATPQNPVREDIPLPLGAVVAVARLSACEKMTEELIRLVPQPERSYGCYEPGRFMWMLEDVKPLRVPIPYAGRQGIFNLEVPSDVLEVLST